MGTTSSGASPVQELGSRILMQATKATDSGETVDPTAKLLDKLKEDLDKSSDLQDLSSQIDAPASASVQTAYAIDAYTAQTAASDPQLTSQAV